LHGYGEGRQLLLSRDITALEQAEAMRRDFVANVSHEIRTPLTVLSGFVETLQTLELDRQASARYLDLMAQQAQRMQTLVSDLLTLSRLEGAPLPGHGEWVSVDAMLDVLSEEGPALSQALGVSHSFRFERGFHGEVAASERELRSALTNLLSNAVRYTPTGGAVTVAAVLTPDDRLVFSVTDTGPGIAPEHLPRLTERFYRVDQSRSRDTGGTGLGLAIVKHVAQRHDALLQVDSVPGHGSSFSISFPALRVRPLG
jgi:two-component system phosphate regulon sensor histidine kinase PhoR